MFIFILLVLSAVGAPRSTSGCFLWGRGERQWCCLGGEGEGDGRGIRETSSEVTKGSRSPFLTGPVDPRVVGLSTGVSALSFAQALLRGGFQPSAIPSASALITCTDHFHESGLSHLHRWESREQILPRFFCRAFKSIVFLAGALSPVHQRGG